MKSLSHALGAIRMHPRTIAQVGGKALGLGPAGAGQWRRRWNRGRARRRIPEVVKLEERALLAGVDTLGLFQLQGAAVNSHPGVAPYDWSDVYYDSQHPGANQ